MTALRSHIRSNVVGYVAVFLAMTGTAVALPGRNTVDSGDIVNGQVKTPDVATNAVTTAKIRNGNVRGADILDGGVGLADLAPDSVDSSKVAAESLRGSDIADNSLGGADIAESNLTQVGSAVLGGFGRGGTEQDTCNPSGAGFATCAGVDITVPPNLGAGARALVIGRVTAFSSAFGALARGFCRLDTSTVGVVPNSSGVVVTDLTSGEGLMVAGISPPLSPGAHQFRIDCNEDESFSGDIDYFDASVIAVAIAAN